MSSHNNTDAIASIPIGSKPTVTNNFPTTLADLNLNSPSLHDSSDSAPTSKQSIYQTLNHLRKSTLSIPNRLRSVLEDAEFVEASWDYLNDFCPETQSPDTTTTTSTTDTLKNDPTEAEKEEEHSDDPTDNEITSSSWPLVPNERSGSWPLDPALKLRSQSAYLTSSPSPSHEKAPVSAYFKSTDGHINAWSFSLRRLNLPVLTLLNHSSSAILLDTTRRGKTYPDALRRTVPIYTSVWNRTLFPHLVSTGICAFQPHDLSGSEISQIEARIPGFVADLKGLGLDTTGIFGDSVRRPVRCVWVAAPSAGKKAWERTFEELVDAIGHERRRWKGVVGEVSILVCCSASRRVLGATEMSEDGYIQGSGDDSEGWSCGLTAKMFWDNREGLMREVDEGGDVEGFVRMLVERSKGVGGSGRSTLIRPTVNIFLGAGGREEENDGAFNLVVDCNSSPGVDESSRLLCLGCKEGKLGSKMLRDKLVGVKTSVEELVRKNSDARILVTCSTGKDLSVGVVLMLLCSFYSDDGKTIQPFLRFRLTFCRTNRAWP